MDTTTHIVEQEEIQQLINNEFQISTETTGGKKNRSCPGCKKQCKVDRLGEHVKKEHPTLWEGLFSVETLQASIDNQQLVKCTIAEGDHDQKFLICLACNSIRTTDRDHFKKNGKIHSDQHFEAATKMIAKKNGVAYVPKYKTDLDTALAKIDILSRHRAICLRDHTDVALAIAEKDEAEIQRLVTLKQLEHDHQFMKNHVKMINAKNSYLRAIADSLKNMYADMPKSASERFVKAFGGICELAQQAAAQ
jgi:hypothetical protein